MKEYLKIVGVCLGLSMAFTAQSQEAYFFSEGTDATFYDQGVVNKSDLGESMFEYTAPPGAPQYNDKVPCSSTAFKGNSSLKFNYTSSENGNWSVNIYRSDWSAADLSDMDSLSFFIYSENEVPVTALPLIGLRGGKTSGSGDVNSTLYALADYNNAVAAGEWTQITFPLKAIFEDAENADLRSSAIKGVIFSQSESNNTSRLILIDELTAFKSIGNVPAVQNLEAVGYDSHAELNWDTPMDGLTYRVYASFDGGQNFEGRGETTDNFYLDFVPSTGKNRSVEYRVVSVFQHEESEPVEQTASIRDFSDDELLDMLERYTFRFFWEGAHPATGMALERTNGSGKTAASGATGMGLMALIAAHERQYRPQSEIKDRILSILEFLKNCDRYHGAWSHWYNADTYETQPFSEKDDGGDLVETSYVAQGLIALRNYFSGADAKSTQIREEADHLWREIDWDWYRQNGQNVLYWHWSPNYGFQMNMKIQGWNECLVTYLLAASSPTHAIPKAVYDQGWARSGSIANPRSYYNYTINLSANWGGPLFFIHYSHLGINPHGLQDQYANYWQEHINTALIHHQYAVENPQGHENYSDQCWGLTASDDPDGYTAHQPMNNDNGTISPTAALASMPYTPAESMKALKYFYRERGAELWGKYGPYDAFNDDRNWVQKAYLGIDQGPIMVMVENYRSGLLWNNVMKDEDLQAGLDRLGFQYQIVTDVSNQQEAENLTVYPNPSTGIIHGRIGTASNLEALEVTVRSVDGRLVFEREWENRGADYSLNLSELRAGLYFIQVKKGDEFQQGKLVIQK